MTSTPVGAEIFINTVDTGEVTPHTFNGRNVGNYDVNVTLAGYDTPTSKSVTVVKGQTATADFTLVQQVGSISVTSSPSGAKIFLDNVDTTQVTPFTLNNVPYGNHDVSVTKDGYVTPPTKVIAVVDKGIVTADFALSLIPPDTGSISVTSTPAGAEIFINTVDTGEVTPHTFNGQNVGNYDVNVTLAGYDTTASKSVTVVKDQTATADFTLVQQVGSISVTSTPTGARIFLDNVDTTQVTPFTLNNVPYGNHDVSVTKDGYVTPSSKSIAIVDKGIVTADFTLSLVPPDTGSINVTSTPAGAEIFINNIDTGEVTPHTFNGRNIGNYDVNVTLAGYDTPTGKSVTVVKDLIATADFTLVQQAGSISVTSSPTGAKIFLDNVDTTQVTPFTLTKVPYGNHDVSVTKDGYVTPPTKVIAVVDEGIVTADFTLSPGPTDTGSIRVSSVPDGAEIFLNGVDTGKQTPVRIQESTGRTL